MKKILLSALVFYIIKGNCQDTLRIRQIDSLVKVINQSNLITQYDSIFQDHPEIGLSMKTYLTTLLDGNNLKKFVNKVNSVRLEKGISKQMTTSNSFYFDQDKLIKVEEVGIEGEKKLYADWYYSENKPLYYTYQSDRSESRAVLLLTMGNNMLKQIQK